MKKTIGVMLALMLIGTFTSAFADIYIIGNPKVYLTDEDTKMSISDFAGEEDHVENPGDNSTEGFREGSYRETEADVFSEESNIMYVTSTPFARLRSDESTKLPYLAKMPQGSQITVLSTNSVGEESWSYIDYNGQLGYCLTKLLGYDNPFEEGVRNPLTLDTAFGTNLLQRGNYFIDPYVKNLQLCLIYGGYLSSDPGADGLFGSATQKALAAFQRAHGLDPVGYAGKTTKAKLWQQYASFLLGSEMP